MVQEDRIERLERAVFGPGSDALDEHDHSGDELNPDALSTGEVTVGQTGPVSGIVGDSGEWEPITTVENGDNTVTKQNTSYEFYEDIGIFPWNRFSVTGYEDYGLSVVGYVTNDTAGATVSLRASRSNGAAFSDSEIEVDIPNANDSVLFSGPIASDISVTESVNYYYEVKNSAGTGGSERTGVSLILWGQIA
jgi:hypothetical protein